MKAADPIDVVFRISAYSLRNSNNCRNSIVTAIVTSDAYQQSPLMNKWESMFYV